MSKDLTSVLEVGSVIEINHELKDGDILTLKSNVVEIYDEDHMVIMAPIHEARLYIIHKDRTVIIKVNKKNAGTHQFKAKIVKRFVKDNINMLYLKRTGSIIHAQRRDFYRHNILMTLKVDMFTEEGLVLESMNAMTKDISGGGLRVIIKKNLPKGMLVRCNIPIEGQMIAPIGEVVRVDKMKDSNVLYDIGISFTDIMERDRSKIISYIFKCQQKAR